MITQTQTRFKLIIVTCLIVMAFWKFEARAQQQAYATPDEDYLFLIDSEDLSDAGVKAVYDARISKKLSELGVSPLVIDEPYVQDQCSYVVLAGKQKYTIWTQCGGEETDQCNATLAFFDIVNRQLADRPFKLYAVYGYNDLAGVFLTPKRYDELRAELKPKFRPYTPHLTRDVTCGEYE